MEILKEEFTVSYSVKFALVRSSASGSFEGNDYSPSVRLISQNVYEVENSKTDNIDDSLQIATFKIECPDNETAGKVAKSIKDRIKKGEVLHFAGSLPNDSKVIKIITPYDTFLSDNISITKTEFKEDKKAK
ncbi:hypothetical protein CPIN18021_0665 [Campylobacter pinnipediorum subsp. caledonicus]|uniref:Uncharacterized protein n=1 Tax=Campylobacter pinnipediorum subsp. caledonicus TaxID=1874362 RepID=A0A1S6U722_9BACT|nr:hypothetical protein [Campylobacter pinnipediorum]AQW85872.1 hypothetical protein CPIN18020_0661 [Campylobacter pinnipediorum subsp. caledonicus]AQW87480.1 hypothetical protein CPIN18021_0665 [Campylobacter pinnipediorum subsp. caledonicus]OPA72375.1 hypothetical protein BB381_02165 [Campylobacter pinnipediorum subsp. caledonicus]